MTPNGHETAERTETGGPTRTPRSEIGPVISQVRREEVGVEPVLLLDLSTSMDWEAAAGEPQWDPKTQTGGRRAIVINALPEFVRSLEGMDSEAAAEQAGGSDEKGGLLTIGFASEAVEIGDLNTSNITRRLNEITWGGGTVIMPAWEMALNDYDEEFGDKPKRERPVHAVLIVTDGEATDWDQFLPVLESADAHRIFVCAVVGYDEDNSKKHSRTVDAYSKVAAHNPHVKVVSFDSVTDPAEIARDLITMLGA